MKSATQSSPTLFPEGFLWGAATSAYQIEGSPLADGAGPSIWHRFAHTPHLMRNGDTGDIACDHYHRFGADIELMKRLGLTAYRFSVSWSRVLPAGVGTVNPAGLGFYERLVDGLLRAGIEPMVTLYHWDLPAALDDRGGWLNPDVAGWFAEYTQTLVRRLDDRVKLWATLNEPWVITDGGYLHGALAPGHRNRFEAPIASHNLMRAHGAAVQAYRACGRHQVGIVVNIEPKYPASDAPEDIAATRRASAYMNEQYLDPVLLGHYPQEMTQVFGEAWPAWPAPDFELIRQPIDFVGINYYTRSVTRFDPGAWPLRATRVKQPSAVYTETDWEVFPQGLTDTLTWVRDRYGPIPQYVTENGAAFADPATAGAAPLDDESRVLYFRQH
ncbi:MAG TPA: family 1 glycosylhydrolase, partial [Burkholderiaceae bacterium]|nr:family 1 glycosylhydrolase [Burkholderiaceae bacterium]